MERRPTLNGFDESETSTFTTKIKEYFYLFWSWAWLILLVGVLVGAAAYAISKRITPVYEASTRLLVSAPPALSGIDTGAMVTSQMMTSTYSKMLVDRPVLQGVIDQLKLQTTPDELKKSITVDIVLNTELLVVTVEDPNPARAADIANALGSVFATRIRELQSQRYAASRSGLEKQVSDMEQQITETSNAITSETDPGTLTQLQARLTQYRTIYSNLVTSYEQVRLAEAQTSTIVIVTEPATTSKVPVSPKTMLNTLLATVLSMLLAAALVLSVDALDDTLKNPDEIRRKFNLPILAVITRHEMKDEKPISLYKPRSPVAEALRSLRTNITYAAVDTPLTRILITSATSQEGKTSIAANLAVVLAQGEKNVLLMDADMRRPMIHHKFGLHNQVGLSDLFLPNPPAREVIQLSEVANLSIITSGPLPPNPVEMLTSKKMTQILDLMRKEYDLILVDTPPVLLVTDATALASGMDGVILVAKPGTTKIKDFQQMLEQLQAVGARLLGVVLNEVNPGSRLYRYYYNRYYSKYSDYHGESELKERARRVLKTSEK